MCVFSSRSEEWRGLHVPFQFCTIPAIVKRVILVRACYDSFTSRYQYSKI